MVTLRGVVGLIAGALLGAVAWALMIAVTSSICSIPVLDALWCSMPGASVPDSITLWDWFLLLAFMGGGAGAGLEQGRRYSRDYLRTPRREAPQNPRNDVPPLNARPWQIADQIEVRRLRGDAVHGRCTIVSLLSTVTYPAFTLVVDGRGFDVYNEDGPKFLTVDWDDVLEAVAERGQWIIYLARVAHVDPFLRRIAVLDLDDPDLFEAYLDDAGLTPDTRP